MPTLLPEAAPSSIARVQRIGMLGTYPPRLCGLATFAAALEREFVRAGREVTMVAVEDGHAAHPSRPHGDELHHGDPGSIRRTAGTLSRCDVVIVQHEYGIYGGRDGDEVLEVMRAIDRPVVVVLHTVPLTPTAHQRSVLEDVCSLATAVVVMTAAAGRRLTDNYAVDPAGVTTIPHGAWSPRTTLGPDRWETPRRVDLVTWGLLGPGKGIEHMIEAMSLLTDARPRVRYTVAGATHPKVFAREGDRYRQSLMRGAWNTGVARSVRFDDAYRDVPDLLRFVSSAALVVLPYDSVDQVTSGVLVDAIAAGRPVIATAFPHAVELLTGGAGILVPHRDPVALAAAVRHAVSEPAVLQQMTRRAREIAPTLAWGAVAATYLALCESLESAGAVADAVG